MEQIEKNRRFKASQSLKYGLKLGWSSKFLWIFGFFVIFPNLFLPIRFFQRLLRDYTITYSPILAVMALITILFLFVILRIIAAGGLIKSVPEYFSRKKIKGGKIFKTGLGHFFQTLVLHIISIFVLLLVGVAAYILFSIISTLGLGGGECLYKILDWIIKFAVFFFSVTTVGVIFSFAQRYSILDQKGLLESYKEGALLFRNNMDFVFRLAAVHLGVWIGIVISTLVIFFLLGIFFALMGTAGIVILFVLMFGFLLAVNAYFGAAFHIMYTHAFYTLTRPDELPSDFAPAEILKPDVKKVDDSKTEAVKVESQEDNSEDEIF